MYLALTDLFRVRWTERIHEEWISGVLKDQGHRLFQGRVGPARFERRPTIRKRREIRVGRRGETPLAPYKFRRPNKEMDLVLVYDGFRRSTRPASSCCVSRWSRSRV